MSTAPEFDVVGVGNALVDVIAHADDGFIHEHVNTSTFTLQDLDVDIARSIPLVLGRLFGT